METTSSSIAKPGRAALWTGRVLSALPVILFLAGGTFGLVKPKEMGDNMGQFGWPAHSVYLIATLEIACALLYAIPRTAVLGAILLTGYLGGAVATHLRIGDPTAIAPFLFGVIVWLGLFLRDTRLRAIIPIRS